MSNADGTLTIGTEINREGLEEDLDNIVDDVESAGEKSGNAFASAFSKVGGKIKSVLSKGFSKVTGVASGLTKTMLNIVGIASKLGLALGVVGVVAGILVSAILIIGGALKKVLSDNSQVKTDLQYMIWAVQKALEPAVNVVADIIVKIVKFLIQAVQVTAVLIKQLTGKNIFANASAEEFAKSLKEADKNSKKTAKNLKEANKQLAGFDEMNVLQDTSSKGEDAKEYGVPSFDLSNLDEVEQKVEKFEKDWMNFGKSMKDTLENAPLSAWFEAFGNFGLAVRGVTTMVYGLWEIITGVFTFIKGAVDLITGLITGDTDLIYKGITGMLDGLWQVIDGFIQLWWGWIQTLVGLIIGIVGTLIDFVVGIIKKGVDWVVNNIFAPVGKWFVEKIEAIKTIIDNVKKFIREKATDVSTWVKEKIDDVVEFFKKIPDKIKKVIDKIKTFFSNLSNDIAGLFKNIGTKVGDTIGSAFKNVINTVLKTVEKILNTPIKAINKLIKEINKLPGVHLDKLDTFSFPRLAKGGIINMPGRGVPIGGAIGGESGAEGVIPLTDSQQMALLGEAIGKYININATIPVYVGNRQIARELKKIEAEDNFAFNR